MSDRADLPDGIYLDMSFETYLALPRVSASSITDLMEGPPAFWARSWMNPDREEPEETAAMLLGRAYHCARLEPEAFDDRYVQEISKDDFADLIDTDTRIKARLKKLGHPQSIAGEAGVLDRAHRLAGVDPGGPPIWHLELEKWEAERGARDAISAKNMAEIRRDAARVRDNPEIADLISGGAAEVSILWTEPETGTRCKCRPDYIAPGRVVHLKTWDMKTPGKPGNRAVADAFRFNGYYRTAWFYHMALSRIEPDSLKLRSENGKPRKFTWAGDDWRSHFLFVRRSGIPDIRAREIMFFDLPPAIKAQAIGADTGKFHRSMSAFARKADIEIRACLRVFAESMEIYGSERPWYPLDMLGTIDDDDFNSYWLDSVETPR